MCGCTRAAPTGDLARNPGMCPDWESNQRPFGLQASTQSSEPHQPGSTLYHFTGNSLGSSVKKLGQHRNK